MASFSAPAPAEQPLRKNLIYTVVLDAPGAEGYRFLGKMLVSSLLRTFFTGDIVVFRNSENPLFLVERKGLEEVYVETPPIIGQAGAEQAWCWKYKVAEMLDVRGYDKVLFLDADCLALRNVDHLLEGDWDIAYQVEREWPGNAAAYSGFYTAEELVRAAPRDGVNSGTMAVRAEIFHEVIKEWALIDTGPMARPESGFRDQASWNALLMRKGTMDQGKVDNGGDVSTPEGTGMDCGPRWKAVPFPQGEIQFPMYVDPHYLNYSQAALTHNCGGDTLEKVQFSFGLYMRTFFCDPTGLFFSMLEM